ncbi:MAG TPA: class A beta-lactamase [Polyangiaceae bacterium]|jgi:beta-lactamase class A|nr:class A beta-lactamase [Polyangiaceae bacterium]
MSVVASRREFLRAFSAVALGGCSARTSQTSARAGIGTDPPDIAGALAAIETRVGGRVGVFGFDTASGVAIARRDDERFAMCSTFKWTLAAAIFEKVDRAELSLDEPVPYGKSDLIEHAPVTENHVADGAMTLEALARAAVTVSDNTAANLLLGRVGGPMALTHAYRRWGDAISRLDRPEPWVNENAPGDPRDTTSPCAMAGMLRTVLAGDVLSSASRAKLLTFLRDCETGRGRLRAGLPPGATIGDKTGTGTRGACNDVAIVTLRGRQPVVIAAYLSDSEAPISALEGAHVAIARLVAMRFALATG